MPQGMEDHTCLLPEGLTLACLEQDVLSDTESNQATELFASHNGDSEQIGQNAASQKFATNFKEDVRNFNIRLGYQGSLHMDSDTELNCSQTSQASLSELDSLLKTAGCNILDQNQNHTNESRSSGNQHFAPVPDASSNGFCEGWQPPRSKTPTSSENLLDNIHDLQSKLNPVTPTKPPDQQNGNSPDPWTPTANLKMLISVASPEIRNRERQRQRGILSDVEVEMKAVPLVPHPEHTVEIEQADVLYIEEEVVFNGNTRQKGSNGRGKTRKILDPGCPEENQNVDAEGAQLSSSRKEKSLGLLCQRFLARFPTDPKPCDHYEISLDEVAKELGVERRRIYDIVNVLESVEMVSRLAKNKYSWHGKSNLRNTLAKLKSLAIMEGFDKQLEKVKEEIGCRQEMRDDIGNCEASKHSSSDENDSFLKGHQRKDKSLGIMSQRFLMLFLVSKPGTVNLEMTAKILVGEPEMCNPDASKFKTKIRRLYDIANILSSLELIRRVYVTEVRGRKPAFQYIGPEVDEHDQIGACVQDGCHRPSSRHSLLDCVNNPQVGCLVDAPTSLKTTLPRTPSLVTELTKCSPTVTPPAVPRLRELKLAEPPQKKVFSRHASFEQICEVAERERNRLYFQSKSSPSSPTKSPAEVVRNPLSMPTVGKAPKPTRVAGGFTPRATTAVIQRAQPEALRNLHPSPRETTPMGRSAAGVATKPFLATGVTAKPGLSTGAGVNALTYSDGKIREGPAATGTPVASPTTKPTLNVIGKPAVYAVSKPSARNASAKPIREHVIYTTSKVLNPAKVVTKAAEGAKKGPAVIAITKDQLLEVLKNAGVTKNGAKVQLQRAAAVCVDAATQSSPQLSAGLVSLLKGQGQTTGTSTSVPETAREVTVGRSEVVQLGAASRTGVKRPGGGELVSPVAPKKPRLVSVQDSVTSSAVYMQPVERRQTDAGVQPLPRVSDKREIAFRVITPPFARGSHEVNTAGSDQINASLYPDENSLDGEVMGGEVGPPSQLNTPTLAGSTTPVFRLGVRNTPVMEPIRGAPAMFQFPPSSAFRPTPSVLGSSLSLPATPTFRLSRTASPVMLLPTRPASLAGLQSQSPPTSLLGQSGQVPVAVPPPSPFTNLDPFVAEAGCGLMPPPPQAVLLTPTLAHKPQEPFLFRSSPSDFFHSSPLLSGGSAPTGRPFRFNGVSPLLLPTSFPSPLPSPTAQQLNFTPTPTGIRIINSIAPSAGKMVNLMQYFSSPPAGSLPASSAATPGVAMATHGPSPLTLLPPQDDLSRPVRLATTLTPHSAQLATPEVQTLRFTPQACYPPTVAAVGFSATPTSHVVTVNGKQVATPGCFFQSTPGGLQSVGGSSCPDQSSAFQVVNRILMGGEGVIPTVRRLQLGLEDPSQ